MSARELIFLTRSRRTQKKIFNNSFTLAIPWSVATLGHLRESWREPCELAVATAYFNLGGYGLLADELDYPAKVRILLGAEPPDPERRGRRLEDHDMAFVCGPERQQQTHEALMLAGIHDQIARADMPTTLPALRHVPHRRRIVPLPPKLIRDNYIGPQITEFAIDATPASWSIERSAGRVGSAKGIRTPI